jgi:hypothetical protein
MTDAKHPPTEKYSATEEAGSIPIVVSHNETKQSPRSFLAPATRTLSEEELAAPGVRRFLISEIERLDERCATLEVLADSYHNLRVEKAVLEARLRASKWHEVLSGLCLAAGSAGIGASSRFLSIDGAHDTGIILLVVSAILVVVGIASKAMK